MRHAAVRKVVPRYLRKLLFLRSYVTMCGEALQPQPILHSDQKIHIPMKANLAHDHALKAGHVALLSGNFEVSVDDSHGKENTCAAAQSTKKIATNGQSSNAGTTESSRGRNDTLELLVHGLLTVTSHDQTLLLELLSDIAG